MKKLVVIVLAILAMACSRNNDVTPGWWLGVIQMDSIPGRLDVPFNFEVKNDNGKIQLIIRNADELIAITEVERMDDSLLAKFPTFTSELVMAINDSLSGYYYPKGTKDGRRYKFFAIKGETDRFPWFEEQPKFNVTGRWWFIENPGTADSTVMVAELKQDGSRVIGTILSTTGDYRYLEGKVAGNMFYFSKCDGAQSIIVRGEITDSTTMENGLISGSPRWVSAWRAMRDDKAQLPEAESLVWVRKGYSTFEFAGTDLNGNRVTSNDERFKGKVLAVLAGGSWCPNCLDEGRFYKTMYEKYRNKGFEVVSLCFEDKTFEAAQPKIKRFAQSIGADYTFLYVAPRGREQRDSVLYALEGQMAYPTSMILDRNGKIRRVETGFSGPGTGEHYQKFARETEELIVKLLNEK
ncbi:MAG: TlpA disulfide reductase family protein [Tenuifilum sp.]|uniref:peroxiredoxin family protein n=1 Tax=Tenuifilum sp. TaxID=2760880 RepID=UPI0030A557AE